MSDAAGALFLLGNEFSMVGLGPRILFNMILAALSMTAFSLSAIAHEEAARVAIIEDYAGDRGLIKLQQDGQAMEVALGTELLRGDVISVSGDGYAVLRFNSGSELVDASRSPFFVTDQSGPLGDMSSNFARVLSVVAWWDDTTSNEPMRSRDGVPPVIAALERIQEPQMLAGTRHIRLVWMDGRGPFDVAIMHGSNQLAGATTPAGIRLLDIDVELVAGETYQLEITDRGGAASQPARYSFRAVGSLPQTTVTVPEGDELRPLLTIAELASHERGRWAFEALQQLYKLPDVSRFRNALINAIEHGDHP